MSADLRAQLQATLGNAYTLERELGGGGMARVFVATETRLRRAVVVKVLSSELAAGVSADRFEREIQLAASLQQANIVPLLSAGDTDGIPYYTMPFVDGESLRARLARDGRLGIGECVSILRDVARALSYAHAHGIVHRDIKPDNVLLSHGAAVVSDFGIAKALSAARTQAGAGTLTQAGTAIGTPAYMAPEQIAADTSADHRVDVYAFGCVAYELLSGRTPFADASQQKVMAAHLSTAPRPITELRPETPPSLAALVMRCLGKEPGARPASADELQSALEAVVTPSGERSMPRQAGKWRAPVALAAGALVIVAASAALFVAQSASTGQDKSIAVLPLVNLSGDQANDYFGEGLAEEITRGLAKAGLHVVGRGSARALAERGLDARDIARQLAVGTVLQGNVQRSGGQVRINVTLVAGNDGSVIWTDKYDRKIQDVFAVQDEIARNVVRELRATLAGGSAASGPLIRAETVDPEAHALYLQGLYLWNRRTSPSIHEAISLFEQAVSRDPNYGRAYAGIALANAILPQYEDAVTDQLAASARAAALRALAIDSTLPEAWTALAYTNAYQWQNADAERNFARAIRLDSTFATARMWHGLYLNHKRRFDEARREFDRAIELEPTSLVIRGAATVMQTGQRQFAAAEAGARRQLELDSTFALARFVLGNVLIDSRKFDEAISLLSAATRVSGVRGTEVRGTLALAYARAGRASDARRVIELLRTDGHGTLPPSGVVAAALMAIGDRATALSVLRAAVDGHDPWIVPFGPSPRYDQLRSDPLGRALLDRTEAR